MRIYIGADHNGFAYKQQIIDFLSRSGHEVVDEGSDGNDPADDFTVFAAKVAHSVLSDKDDKVRGILLCGSGQGVCMAANRFKGIRASLCWNLTEARSARNDDDCNVLCLSAREVDMQQTQAIITTWLETPFAGAARFVRRVKQLDQLT